MLLLFTKIVDAGLDFQACQIRAICDYGITESEMKRYMDAMLKDRWLDHSLVVDDWGQ